MAGKLRLVIVTPEGKTFDDDVEQVVMPGVSWGFCPATCRC